MGLYAKYILPKLIDVSCGVGPIMKQRAKIVPRASGNILEIGIGSGLNLDFYDRSQVKKIIGLEPSAEMRLMAQQRAKDLAMDVDFIGLDAEQIPLDDNDVDNIVVTYSLCTIPDLSTALAQMRRVLKPGGRLFFCEHGLAPEGSTRQWQYRIEPIWKRIAGGCHLTRNIPVEISAAGFRLGAVETMFLPKTFRVAGYNYWGEAHKE